MCVCFQIQPFLFFPPSAKGTISFLLFLLSVFFILLSSVSSPPSSLCSSLPLLSFRLLLHFSSSCIFSSLPLLHSFLLPSPIFPYCFFSWFYFFYLQPFPPSSSLFHFFSLGCFMLLYLLISYPSIAPLLILSSFLSSFCFSLGSFLNVSLSRLLS